MYVIAASHPTQLLADLYFLVSGLSAAHTIYLAGGNVVVLDKQGMRLLLGERIK